MAHLHCCEAPQIPAVSPKICTINAPVATQH